MKSPKNDTDKKIDRAAINSKQRMYKAAQDVEGEGEQASKSIASSVERAAREADTAATKAANSAKDRMFKAAREVEAARTATTESIEATLAEATQEAVQQAAASSEEAAEQAEQNASASQKAVGNINEKLTEAQELLDNLRQVHGISTDVAIGGSHDKTAQEERAAADAWREKSIKYRAWTAVVAAAYAAVTIAFPPEGWEWALRSPLGASAVVILAWMAKYASDQSSEHRITANIYKHQSLAFTSLRHYAQDIARLSGSRDGGQEDDDYDDDATAKSQDTSELLSDEILKSLFTNQIDAFTHHIRASRRSDRLPWLPWRRIRSEHSGQ